MDKKELTKFVLNKSNEIYTTSLIIAKEFNKEHKNVLRAIENLELDKEFNQRNFILSSYTDAKCENRPMYKLSIEGALLLIFSFTGKDTIKAKSKIVEKLCSEYSGILSYLKEFMVDRSDNPIMGFVYIIKDYSNGYYKIGKTTDLERRLKQLKTGNINIEIICSLQDINYGLIETKLHRENEDRLIYGEWFHIKDRLENIINQYEFERCLDKVSYA